MHGIVTPDAVVLELETAGLASRVVAGLLDLAIQIGALVAAAIVIGIVALGVGTDAESFYTTAYAIVFTAVLFGYPVLCETMWRGRTVGKRWLGLRAVTLDGAPITARHAVLRMMGGLVDRLLPPGGITGALFVLGTRRHQRVGDLIAGTIVVRDPERTALPVAVWFPVPPGHEAYAATIDPTAMTVEQYTVVRAFLLRARTLSAEARWGVADDLAGRLADALHHVRPPGIHPEAFLLCAVARYQRRTFPAYQPPAWQPGAWGGAPIGPGARR